MIIIKQAELEEILFVARNLRPCDQEESFAQRWSDDPVEFALDVHKCPGVKWTAIDESGQPIIVGGLMFHNPKVAQGFTFSTPRGAPEQNPKAWVKVSRHSLRLFKEVFKETDIRRIELVAIESKKVAQRWVERLGFSVEAVMPQKGKFGESFVLSVMLKGD